MVYVVAYAVALVVFVAIDVAYLTSFGGRHFKDTLGDIVAADLRIGPAIVFYLGFPAGLALFAVSPGLRDNSVMTAALYGALFGLFTYGTYDLTNYATLRNWTLGLSLLDMAYGAAIAGLTAAVAWMVAVRWIA